MTLEGVIANAQDLERIQRLTDAGCFAPWFPAYARSHATLYVMRIWWLAAKHYLRHYPGPTVTE